MCGRFNQTASANKLKASFSIKTFKCDEAAIQPRYNIAPSQDVLVVRADLPRHERSASLLHKTPDQHWQQRSSTETVSPLGNVESGDVERPRQARYV